MGEISRISHQGIRADGDGLGLLDAALEWRARFGAQRQAAGGIVNNWKIEIRVTESNPDF